MRTLLASAALLSLACSVPAFAQSADPAATPDAGTATDTPAATGGTVQPAPPMHHHRLRRPAGADGQQFAHEPGTGESGPASAKASNISASDSRSAIAPHLPHPRGGMNAGPWNYLRDADHALAMHHTGEAQQALEMAETRLLDRSTPVSEAGQPAQSPEIVQVNQARKALGAGDIAGARAAIHTALASAPQAAGMGRNRADDSGMTTSGGPVASPGPVTSPGPATSLGMSATTSQPGGAPMGNGMPSSGSMSPTGAGPTAGKSAGASVGGGAAGTGTADSAGGAK